MQIKKLAVITLSALMVISAAAGCGNNEAAGGAEVSQNTTGSGSDSAAQNSEEHLEDMANITMVYMPVGGLPKGVQEVEDAVNY